MSHRINHNFHPLQLHDLNDALLVSFVIAIVFWLLCIGHNRGYSGRLTVDGIIWCVPVEVHRQHLIFLCRELISLPPLVPEVSCVNVWAAIFWTKLIIPFSYWVCVAYVDKFRHDWIKMVLTQLTMTKSHIAAFLLKITCLANGHVYNNRCIKQKTCVDFISAI